MKLKQKPEDFRVEELTDREPRDRGSFAFYRLEKTGWSTPDALQAIRRRWRLEFKRLSYGGLKDRHAHTIQYLTILHGPRRDLTHHTVTVSYLGLLNHPYTSSDIRANRFQLALRDLTVEELGKARTALNELRSDGLPNYFDDQRFGSLGEQTEFAARYMVLGQFEKALQLVLCAPYAHDRSPLRKEKAILRTHWGDWPACKERLERGHARSLMDYLVHHPADIKGAVARLKPELRTLYLSAYQSYLWNRSLGTWIERKSPPEQLIWLEQERWKLPVLRGLTAEQRGEFSRLQWPLPSSRTKLPEDDPRRAVLEEFVGKEGFALEQMKIPGIRDLFFSKGDRAAWLDPDDLNISDDEDELHATRRKLILGFNLPRGSYATLLVKRIQAAI